MVMLAVDETVIKTRAPKRPLGPGETANRRWRLANPDAACASSRRANLWKSYRLRLEDYERILAAQGGACAICETRKPGAYSNFAVDHDHACCPGFKSCGKCVRGLICTGCNRKLASLDDRAWFARVTEYLTRGVGVPGPRGGDLDGKDL